MARMLKDSPPKRSALIIFHGAEEKGMLGSDYLTMPETNKPFDLHQIVSYLNFDMIGRGHTDSIFIIGSDRISVDLKNMIEAVNKQNRLFYFDYAFNRDDDPNHYFYRSDHYNYARENIPIAFFFDGMTVDYHKISDTADKINILKITKMVNLGYQTIKAIGNRTKRFRHTGE
jgi:Zn-dependent M28 family amino/carboxypeptidase